MNDAPAAAGAGAALGAGDADGDGIDELLGGAPDEGAARVYSEQDVGEDWSGRSASPRKTSKRAERPGKTSLDRQRHIPVGGGTGSTAPAASGSAAGRSSAACAAFGSAAGRGAAASAATRSSAGRAPAGSAAPRSSA